MIIRRHCNAHRFPQQEPLIKPDFASAAERPHTATAAPLLVVPGHGNSGPGHWQTWLEQRHPDATRVMQRHWKLPVRRPWVAALERAVQDQRDAKPILVGHSIGAMTIVQWAATSAARAKVAGALLVAPPDLEARLPGMPPPWATRWAGWAPIPRQRLPWKSILVASSNDPMCAMERSRAFAQAWGSEFIDLGPAGHVNDAAGFGEWPQVHALIDALMS